MKPEDDLGPARGVVFGALAAVVIWCLLALLFGCGGGAGDEPATAAEAAARKGTQPVNCVGVSGLQCQ